ncbi:MAG: hypothetical protein DRO14_06040 [Thermoprotei archaeon]|nr:MAG: hypothetical protein DRO14_06040 [Thermoprotei archaeon]
MVSYEPLPDAKVKILKNGTIIAKGLTNANGVFETYLPSNGYNICVEKDGYLGECKGVLVDRDLQVDILLRRITRIDRSATTVLRVTGEVEDSGSTLCLSWGYDPGNPVHTLPYGYDYIYSWCDENEFTQHWSIAETNNVEPVIHENILKLKSATTVSEYYARIEWMINEQIRAININAKLDLRFYEYIKVIAYDEPDSEYPYSVFKLRNQQFLFNMRLSYKRCIAPNKCYSGFNEEHYEYKWDGTLVYMILFDEKIHKCYRYEELIVSDINPRLIGTAMPKRILIEIGAEPGYCLGGEDNYCTPMIDWIGIDLV